MPIPQDNAPSYKPDLILEYQRFGPSLGQAQAACAHGAVYQVDVQLNDDFELVVVLSGHADGDPLWM